MMHRRMLAPAVVLFTIMVAHAILETAREALFLAHLGPERLAWAYLAIALGALLALFAVRQWGSVRDPRRMLIGFLCAAAIGTALLALTIPRTQSAVFILYVWTGLVATLVVPAFWTTMDRSLRLTQAKQTFAAIGAGGILGAMIGSAVAGVLGRLVPPVTLVSVGAVAFGVATVVAVVLAPRPIDEHAPRPRHAGEVQEIQPRRYVRWILALGIASTVTLTLGDLLFKRVISEELPPEDLATAFGAMYTALNLLALTIQLALTPRLLSRLGVTNAHLVLPAILVATACGFAMTGALIAIIALKLSDGGLRHSLHRVTSEIFYMPVPTTVRDGAKPIADALGHRGGQALAALIMFVLGALSAASTTLAIATAVAGTIWLTVVAVVRNRYMLQFRDMLRAGEVHRGGRIPELDATSIEILVASLSSPDEVEALAALDLLHRRGGRGKIPPLVLYHPSNTVVRAALSRLAGDVRPEMARVLEYLFDHEDPQIRAGALAAASIAGCHREYVIEALEDRDLQVRAAALVVTARDPEHAAASAAGISTLAAASPAARVALVRAIGFVPDRRFHGALTEMLARREPAVLREILNVLVRAPLLVEVERLTALLQDPHVRSDTRRVFRELGERGLVHLITALDDPRTPLSVRRHIPRTISQYRSRRAISALVARLTREPDGNTEFKLLRAVGRMRADHPELAVDTIAIRTYIRGAIADAARYATLADRFAEDHVEGASAQLIRELLVEKRERAIEHVFRAFAILWPNTGLRSVHAAIASRDPERRAAAREVLEQLLRAEQRAPLFAILEDLTPEERRESLGELAAGPFPTYESFLAALLDDPSESLRCIAAHHVAERKLVALRANLVARAALAGPPLVVHAFEQAIARLDA